MRKRKQRFLAICATVLLLLNIFGSSASSPATPTVQANNLVDSGGGGSDAHPCHYPLPHCKG
jgi:hypothetical protein